MHDAIYHDSEFEVIQSELLLNLIAIVKYQQANIELLWEAFGAGKAPPHALLRMRESSGRLTASVENFYGLIARNGQTVN